MKKTISVLLALMLMFTLCACGESSSAQNARTEMKAEYADYEYAADEAYYYAEEPMYEPAPAAANGLSVNQSASAGGSAETPSQKPSKIIYSANVRVETTDFDGTLSALDQLVEEYGGWIESSSVNGTNYADRSRGSVSRRSASYTLRIPSDRFQELMSSLSALGNIPFSHIYTENVTAQYYDVQARLVAYTAQEQRLLEMMEMAETVEDVILLEDRLTEVRYQIEALQSTLNNWDRQVSFSSVYLDISEVQEYSPEPQVQPSYGQQLLSALQDGLHDAGAFFKGLLLWLTGALPALVILAVLTVVVVLIVKRIRKKRRAAREAAREAARSVPPKPADEVPEDL